MGDNVWNFVGSHGSLSDSAKFICSLFISDLSENETSFDVNQNSIIFPDFWDGENVHEAQWEFGVFSHSVVNVNVSTRLSADHNGFLAVQGELEVVSRKGQWWMCWGLP